MLRSSARLPAKCLVAILCRMERTLPYGVKSPGTMTIAIGVIHQLFGFAAGFGLLAAPDGTFHAPLLELLRDGVLGQADAEPLRMAIVWFLLFGFLLIFCGVALLHLERSGARPTRSLAVGYGSLWLLGVLLMPASGLWLGFAPTLFLWRGAQPQS